MQWPQLPYTLISDTMPPPPTDCRCNGWRADNCYIDTVWGRDNEPCR